jgi:hypothetical protein
MFRLYNKDSAAIEYIKQLPSVKQVRQNARAFATNEEFDWWTKAQIEYALQYIGARKLFEREVIPYKAFSLNKEQRELITSIGGKVLDQKDREMFIIEVPSKMLTKDIRERLHIERVRLTNMSGQTIPLLVSEQLNRIAKGWRGESDHSTKEAIFITFPYHDLNERDTIKSKIEQANRVAAMINTKQAGGISQGFSKS